MRGSRGRNNTVTGPLVLCNDCRPGARTVKDLPAPGLEKAGQDQSGSDQFGINGSVRNSVSFL